MERAEDASHTKTYSELNMQVATLHHGIPVSCCVGPSLLLVTASQTPSIQISKAPYTLQPIKLPYQTNLVGNSAGPFAASILYMLANAWLIAAYCMNIQKKTPTSYQNSRTRSCDHAHATLGLTL